MIRIPRKHIADSVSERIMQVQEKLNPNNVIQQGQNLEQAMAQPIGDVAPLEGIETMIPERALGL